MQIHIWTLDYNLETLERVITGIGVDRYIEFSNASIGANGWVEISMEIYQFRMLQENNARVLAPYRKLEDN